MKWYEFRRCYITGYFIIYMDILLIPMTTWISSTTGASQIVKYDDLGDVNEYTFTKDYMFAIKPYTPDKNSIMAEYQTTSNSLYIRSNVQIDPTSALQKLINMGIIEKKIGVKISVPTGQPQDKNTKRKISAQVTAVDFTEYQFFRPLIDNRLYSDITQENPIGTPDYTSEDKNENDCLKFAETLTYVSEHASNVPTETKNLLTKLLAANTNPSFLQTREKYNNRNFPFAEIVEIRKLRNCAKNTSGQEVGLSDIDYYNSQIVTIIHNNTKEKTNNYAVPTNGQNYAIVRKEVCKNTAYHAAFVVYTTHGGVNITLEAEADNGKTYLPKFCFYDTNQSGNTFHNRWSGELYKNKCPNKPPESKPSNMLQEDYDEYVECFNRHNSLYNNGITLVLETRGYEVITNLLKEEEDKKSNQMLSVFTLPTTNGTKRNACIVEKPEDKCELRTPTTKKKPKRGGYKVDQNSKTRNKSNKTKNKKTRNKYI
jgi:hypothetical protein